MRILRSVRHKACADGSYMKEFLLDTPLPARFLEFLAGFGGVKMLPALGEGFYTFEKPDCFSIKGFLNDTSIEVRFRKEVMDLTNDFLYALLFYYRDGDPDLAMLNRLDVALKEKVVKRLYGTRGT
jgi:hypothetical protein